MKNMMMIGNAHLDPVWLWQWREGFHEAKATFRSALDRLNEFPDFVFTCACAQYYSWVEENDPEMFAEIQQRVREGRWSIVGGMWIQPDMNVPSGESFARQLMYSQRYFKEKFGLTASTSYNVDSFGHNAMTPQLLKKAGIDNYVWMRPSIVENPNIPEGALWWESPDGSRVLSYRIHGEYAAYSDIAGKIERLFQFSERVGTPVMCFYGIGNHGGGPTIQNLREMNDYIANGARGSEVGCASVDEYFNRLRADNTQLPVWKNELQHHASGCYSTHSTSKRMHRQAENALVRMETLGAISRALTGHELKTPFVQQAWSNLMFNEFHDIMGGCSIPEALVDVQTQLSESISIADREENAAIQRVSWKVDTVKGNPNRVRSKESFWLWYSNGQGTPVVVFNPHGFDAEGAVQINQPLTAVRDDDGNDVPVQRVRATRTNSADCWNAVFRAKVPALGYRLYWVFMDNPAEAAETALSASETHIENEHLRAEFDPHTGALTHLIRKADGADALKAPARAKLMDIEPSDTWGHMIFKFDEPAGMFSNTRITVLENGPVRATVRVTTKFGTSELEQKYTLYAGADQLDVQARLNLHENHRMLKLCFPTEYPTDVSEIPYGVLPREGNGNEEPCQRWVAMQGESAGLAVLNDGRYSYSAPDGELRLTMANTSICADHYGQNYRDDTCEFMDQNELRLNYALVPYAGSWRDAGLNRRAALLNRPMTHVAETYHEGPLGGEYRGISIDSPYIELGALKRAEDGAGYVLRLVETTGRDAHVSVQLPLLNRDLTLDFTPFEIKTVYLPDDPAAAARETLLTELD